MRIEVLKLRYESLATKKKTKRELFEMILVCNRKLRQLEHFESEIRIPIKYWLYKLLTLALTLPRFDTKILLLFCDLLDTQLGTDTGTKW